MSGGDEHDEYYHVFGRPEHMKSNADRPMIAQFRIATCTLNAWGWVIAGPEIRPSPPPPLQNSNIHNLMKCPIRRPFGLCCEKTPSLD